MQVSCETRQIWLNPTWTFEELGSPPRYIPQYVVRLGLEAAMGTYDPTTTKWADETSIGRAKVDQTQMKRRDWPTWIWLIGSSNSRIGQGCAA